MNWIELHTNTRYSDVLSFIDPKQMVSACARHSCRAVAITDRNTVQAYLSAEQEAAERGIALIYGVTIDCMDRDDRYAVTLLARNMKGRDQIFDLVKLLKRCEAEEWFITVCQKVQYLFPESHSIAYAILMIRLVWYVLHYPDVTDSLMIETAMELLQE